jgi:hypothetical protein
LKLAVKVCCNGSEEVEDREDNVDDAIVCFANSPPKMRSAFAFLSFLHCLPPATT